VFTDSDCYPEPGWLTAVAMALAEEETGIVMGPRLPPTHNRSLELIAEYENKKAEVIFGSNDTSIYFGYTNNMAVRRSVMEQVGPFERRSRGSDTIFIRRAVEALGCDVVAYCPDMVVRHGELTSIATYYNKVRTYARYRKNFSHIMKVRPLSLKERLDSFRQVSRETSVLRSIQLFGLLLVGVLFWWHGGRS